MQTFDNRRPAVRPPAQGNTLPRLHPSVPYTTNEALDKLLHQQSRRRFAPMPQYTPDPDVGFPSIYEPFFDDYEPGLLDWLMYGSAASQRQVLL